MRTFAAFANGLERFTQRVNRIFVLIGSVLVAAMMLVTVREVFVRYVLDDPSRWAMDGSRFALVYVFFLALAPALESGHHVSVDLFDPLLPRAVRRYQQPAAYLLVLFFAAVLFYYVSAVTLEVFDTGEMTYSVVPVQLKYIYCIGPIGVGEFWLTALVGFIRACQGAPLLARATETPSGA